MPWDGLAPHPVCPPPSALGFLRSSLQAHHRLILYTLSDMGDEFITCIYSSLQGRIERSSMHSDWTELQDQGAAVAIKRARKGTTGRARRQEQNSRKTGGRLRPTCDPSSARTKCHSWLLIAPHLHFLSTHVFFPLYSRTCTSYVPPIKQIEHLDTGGCHFYT